MSRRKCCCDKCELGGNCSILREEGKSTFDALTLKVPQGLQDIDSCTIGNQYVCRDDLTGTFPLLHGIQPNDFDWVLSVTVPGCHCNVQEAGVKLRFWLVCEAGQCVAYVCLEAVQKNNHQDCIDAGLPEGTTQTFLYKAKGPVDLRDGKKFELAFHSESHAPDEKFFCQTGSYPSTVTIEEST